MVQSTQKRLCAAGEKGRKRREHLIWLDNPHASDEEREKLVQQAIAAGRMQESDDVQFVSWMTCLSADCPVCRPAKTEPEGN
jgi:hypothetical protein